MRYTVMLQAVTKAINAALAKDITPCISSDMGMAIELWAAMYADTPPWLSCKKGIESAGLSAGISAEVARLVTIEMQAKAADEAVDAILQRLVDGIHVPTEHACALGGVLFKPYKTGSGIEMQYIRADRFFPLGFDSSGNISECVLVEQAYASKSIYTRLEYYSLAEKRVYNLAYRNRNYAGAVTLGSPIALTDYPAWADLRPEAELKTDKLPFGYFKIPTANNIDPDFPLGLSVFARAVTLIKEADKKYSNINWEYEAKQAAVHIAASLLKRNESTGDFEYPGGQERLYRTLEYNLGATDKPLIDTFSPDIRADDLYKGYQEQLKMIEFTCGLAYGTLSDPQQTDKTATEIRSSKQRLYVTVSSIQKALENALNDTAAAIAYWLGRPAPTVTYTWDDSIVVDSEALSRQALLELQSGVIDNVEYYKRVYGMDEADALKLAQDIAARSPAPKDADFFSDGDGDGSDGDGE